MSFYMETGKRYDTVGEYLAFETYGLAEDVSADEMRALKDGAIPIAEIADRYMEDIDHDRVGTDEATTRTDLLSWISSEIEGSREMDRQAAKDDVMCAALAEIKSYAEYKKSVEARMQATLVELLLSARGASATKGAIADAAGISRPTLDAWLASTTMLGIRECLPVDTGNERH